MNKINTVQSLRKSGFDVKVNHYRFAVHTVRPVVNIVAKSTLHGIHYIDAVAQELELFPLRKSLLPKNEIFPRGGITEVILIKDDKTSVGVAHCSLADNYVRREGINKAIGRALSDFENGVYL